MLGITRYSDSASRKHYGNLLSFVIAGEFWGEINTAVSSVLKHKTSPDLSHRLFITEK